MKAFVDCSWTNAKGTVYVGEDFQHVAPKLNEEVEVLGFWHPDGVAATQEWVKQHADLVSEITGDPKLTPASASSEPEPPKEDETEQPIEKPVAEPEEAESESEEDTPEPSAEELVAEPVVPTADLLIAAGVPESLTDELLAAGLDTPDKVLDHPNLSQVKGIGVKSKKKILSALSKDE